MISIEQNPNWFGFERPSNDNNKNFSEYAGIRFSTMKSILRRQSRDGIYDMPNIVYLSLHLRWRSLRNSLNWLIELHFWSRFEVKLDQKVQFRTWSTRWSKSHRKMVVLCEKILSVEIEICLNNKSWSNRFLNDNFIVEYGRIRKIVCLHFVVVAWEVLPVVFGERCAY